jgi:pyruvate-ferredoxin/flavodoxin oxidoreductase
MKRKQMTLDGNTATAHISYAFTEVATIFPITPSSPMAEQIDEWSAAGRKNLFGRPVLVKQMQSEGGAAGAMHGTLLGGALTSTYTASQGLMLMLPVVYRIAGELLPGVFNVSSRALGNNAFSIFGDHQDVMTLRAAGATMMCSSSVQDCADLTAVAHLSAIKARIPIVHFFDGFRTSHEVQKVEMLEYDELAKLVDWEAVNAFRDRAMNPDHPMLHGCTENPDIYFQSREAVNKFYLPIPSIVQGYMDQISALTGRDYKLFNYYGSPTAENIIISMGSSCSVIKETIDYQNARGANYGLVQVRLFRPLPVMLLVCLLLAWPSLAQQDGVRHVAAYRTTEDMRVDGILSEAVWRDAQPITELVQREPQPAGKAGAQIVQLSGVEGRGE